MNVLMIKGMEMPKDGCRDCIFVNRKWHGDVCPILKREVTGNVERGGFQTDCPLVPVPKHGRLIEEVDAVETVWMILRGLGYLKGENPQLEQTVREVFATVPAIEVEDHG